MLWVDLIFGAKTSSHTDKGEKLVKPVKQKERRGGHRAFTGPLTWSGPWPSVGPLPSIGPLPPWAPRLRWAPAFDRHASYEGRQKERDLCFRNDERCNPFVSVPVQSFFNMLFPLQVEELSRYSDRTRCSHISKTLVFHLLMQADWVGRWKAYVLLMCEHATEKEKKIRPVI